MGYKDMMIDLPMSDKFRFNTTALVTIRLALNELMYRYQNDTDSKWLVHQAKELREMMYPKERHLLDIERNMVRSNWGGERIYSDLTKTGESEE